MKAKLIIIGALGAAALNAFAGITIDQDKSEADQAYEYIIGENAGGWNALTVTNNATYTGSNITLTSATGDGATVAAGSTLVLHDSTITVNGASGNALMLSGNGAATAELYNVTISATGGYNVWAENGSTLTMVGGTIQNGGGGYGIVIYDTNTTSITGATITADVGIYVSAYTGASGTLKLTNSNINSYTALWLENTNATVALNDNTVAGNIRADNSTIALSGSNSQITGAIVAATSGTVTVTLDGEGSVLHGNFNQDSGGAITLTLNAGATLEGAGTVSELTLNDGTTYIYTEGGLTVTDSITLGTITIDLSNLDADDLGEDLIVFDWGTLDVDISTDNFNFTGAGVAGAFSTDSDGNLIFNATAVPEPSTWFLLGVGLGILALTRLCRRT